MERLLTSIERRVGRFAPAHIIWWLVGLSGIVYFLILAKPEVAEAVVLDGGAIRDGEVWRLVTFLFMPWSVQGGTLGPIFTIFALLFLYTIGNSLEQEWGTFRFDAFYLLAVVGTIASALLVGPVTNIFINQALLLAFAIEFPDYEIRLYFFLPIRMRWIGLLTVGLLGYQFVSGSWPERSGIAVAIVALLLFCGNALGDRLRGRSRVSAQAREMNRFRAAAATPARARVCALCGKSERDDPRLEFRVCNCAEKCGGRMTEYCIEHAKSH